MSESIEKIDLTIVILTFNEEKNIRRCFKSLPRGCEIIVVDSGSCDSTVKIVKEYTDKVFHNEFVDFSSQRNFALKKLPATGSLQ